MPTEPGSGSAAQIERRKSPRYPFDAVVELEWGSAKLRGRVSDISAEGMRIEIGDPLWLGAGFWAQVALDPPLRLECVVRRIEPGRSMGVSFGVPGEESRAQLAALLETLAKKK
jgi:hypothetical protein